MNQHTLESKNSPFIFLMIEHFGTYWKVLLISVCLGIVASSVYAFSAPKWYRSSVLLIPREESTSFGGVAGLSGQLSAVAGLAGVNIAGRGSLRDEGIARLKSRDFIESFIRDLNLLPVLFSERWDIESGEWSDDSDPPSYQDAFTFFREDVFFVVDEGVSGMVRASIDWTDAELASDWLTLLIRRINEDLRQRTILESESSIKYLEEQLETARVLEVQQAIGRLLESQITTKMLSSVRQDFIFGVIDPPRVADADRHIRPIKSLAIVAGALVGLIIGLLLAILHSVFLEYRKFQQQ